MIFSTHFWVFLVLWCSLMFWIIFVIFFRSFSKVTVLFCTLEGLPGVWDLTLILLFCCSFSHEISFLVLSKEGVAQDSFFKFTELCLLLFLCSVQNMETWCMRYTRLPGLFYLGFLSFCPLLYLSCLMLISAHQLSWVWGLLSSLLRRGDRSQLPPPCRALLSCLSSALGLGRSPPTSGCCSQINLLCFPQYLWALWGVLMSSGNSLRAYFFPSRCYPM